MEVCLSTIRSAERIVVLTVDGITEQGSHIELLARNGAYAHLYSKQFEFTSIVIIQKSARS
jgi:ATP-binding cassette subfamily B protein